MHRIDADAHVSNQFSNGDAGIGQPGTKVDADWLNAVQEEIAGFIESMGITLAKGSHAQLTAAVLALLARVNTWTAAQAFSAGMTAAGAAPNGPGVHGVGVGTGPGVIGENASGNAPGVLGNGHGTSPGVSGQGGVDIIAGGAPGVQGTGGNVTLGSGPGGAGVRGVGGSAYGVGGRDGGPGGTFEPHSLATPTRGNIQLVPLTATPVAPVDGDLWVENVGGTWHLKVRMNGATSTIV